MRRRSIWGWGYEGEGPDPAALAMAEAGLAHFLGGGRPPREPPDARQLALRKARARPPASLADLVTDEPHARASHAYGKSYKDVVRALSGDFEGAPDLVAHPRSEGDVERLLAFCSEAGLAVVPYGGGSSVSGGVEPPREGFAASLSLDTTVMGSVLEIDRVSRAARIQGGALGPSLEAELKPHGLTLRHFPQSFEFSTLGGWIATRSAGHYATGPTHIDELVESLRMVSPAGTFETRRLPGSGAGPSPDRLAIGSEGIFGVITEAWVRVTERPRFHAGASVRFPDFARGAGAVRALAQSGLQPANCRLLDPLEAMMNGAGSGDEAILVLGFESADHSLGAWMARAAELCRDQGGLVPESAIRTREDAGREGAAGAWRSAFLRAPYLRDALVLRGYFVETYETAVTWERLDALCASVRAAAERAVSPRGKALVSCRLTHAYPDGAAPYFTVVTPAREGSELALWREVKHAVTEAMLEAGGTSTHHHAVGKDVVPFYAKERPDLFARALLAAKAVFDPKGVMNPGVLLGPR